MATVEKMDMRMQTINTLLRFTILSLCLALLRLAWHPLHAETVSVTVIDNSEDPQAFGYPDSRKLVADGQGHLYVAYRKKFRQPSLLRYHIFVARSDNNGATWTVLNQGQPIETVGDYTQRVPSLAIDSAGTLHVVWYGEDASSLGTNDRQIKYARSSDGGQTWSGWQNIAYVLGYGGQTLWQEHPVISVASNGMIYVAWEGRDATYASNSQIKFTCSTDGGVSWQPWSNINANGSRPFSRPAMVEVAGTLYLLAYNRIATDDTRIVWTKSTDDGENWDAWATISLNGKDQRHFSLISDTVGRLHVVWRQYPDSAGTFPTQIYHSVYAGNAWSIPTRISPNPTKYQLFPTMTQSRDGRRWVSWIETSATSSVPNDDPSDGTIFYATQDASELTQWRDRVQLRNATNDLYPSLGYYAKPTQPQHVCDQANGVELVWLEAQAVDQNALNFTCLTTPGTQTNSVALTYVATEEQFANPERGFYHYVETRGSAPLAYELTTLQSYRNNENITLLYCIHYLDTFVNTPISASFLQHIQSNLNTVRNAGLKCILRFAYTDDWNNETPPFGDASKAQILAHIAQLEPILRANSDVIAVVQAGFIGVWGEWYYTDHFVDDPATPWIVSPARQADRREVLQRLLDALPTTRMVQVRYPHGKQAMFNTTTPIAPALANSGAAIARTGFHNDCFLASDTDYGTYRDDQIAADKAYVASETLYLPMGGETCNPNPPRTDCPTALEELALLHWSYLNREYNADVYDGWVNGGCSDTIERELGYRLALQTGSYTRTVKPGGGLGVQIVLQNQGFAAPVNPRGVELILRALSDGTIYRVALPDDLRTWFSDTTITLDSTLGIPADMPLGEYELLLFLPAPEITLRNRPEYAIRLANQAGWEPSTGYNKLNQVVTVDSQGGAAPYSGDRFFTANSLPASPLTTIARNGTNVTLSWTNSNANQTYEVHRSATPFFTASADTLYAVLPSGVAQYQDWGAIGGAATQYYYQIRAASMVDGQPAQFALSNEVGKIDYSLNNTGSKYTLLAVPFASPSITNAASLATHIGGVGALLKWNPTTQTFRFFVPPSSGDNFALATGDAVFVLVNSGGPNRITMLGNVAPIQFDLRRGGFNFISLPLQKAELTNASGVATDIEGVTALLSWNEQTQLFRFFTPPSSGDNFVVQPGMPFAINLSADGSSRWPAPAD